MGKACGPSSGVSRPGGVSPPTTKRAGGFVLRLYVTGGTPHSNGAIRNVRALCEGYLDGHYDLEVIDIRQDPRLACEAQIIVAPTLVKAMPPPLQRFTGALSDLESILVELGLLGERTKGVRNGQ
jgi:circadian clock protein KaiB